MLSMTNTILSLVKQKNEVYFFKISIKIHVYLTLEITGPKNLVVLIILILNHMYF